MAFFLLCIFPWSSLCRSVCSLLSLRTPIIITSENNVSEICITNNYIWKDCISKKRSCSEVPGGPKLWGKANPLNTPCWEQKIVIWKDIKLFGFSLTSYGPLEQGINVSGCDNRFYSLRLSRNSVSISSQVPYHWLPVPCGVFLITNYLHIPKCFLYILEIPWNGEKFMALIIWGENSWKIS